MDNKRRPGIEMSNSAFSSSSFGGYKQSGFNHELATEALNLYTETKSVISYGWRKTTEHFGICHKKHYFFYNNVKKTFAFF